MSTSADHASEARGLAPAPGVAAVRTPPVWADYLQLTKPRLLEAGNPDRYQADGFGGHLDQTGVNQGNPALP